MLSPTTQSDIVAEALRYLGKEYDRSHFNCLTFARLVYEKVGLKLPPIQLNITPLQLTDPPLGYVLYLKYKQSKSTGKFTHVGILIGNRECIHCSYFFGGKVVITRLDELFGVYELAG